MAGNDRSSPSNLRFLGLSNHPAVPYQDADPLELHESDVVWSFAVSPDHNSYSNSNSNSPTSPSLPHHDHRQRFNFSKSGLSAALLEDDDGHHQPIRRKSAANRKIIPQPARQEDIPAKHPQSAPVNIPVWPMKYKNDNLKSFDEMEEDDDEIKREEEMVPPHVIVARSHVTFSVFEGAGRTLKGRDLRRVRNAVFQKTGFID